MYWQKHELQAYWRNSGDARNSKQNLWKWIVKFHMTDLISIFKITQLALELLAPCKSWLEKLLNYNKTIH